MNFKLFIESDVAKWKDRIDSINRESVFNHWFPNNERVYIPFKSENNSSIDVDIENYFKNHEKYKIVDYVKGLAVDNFGRNVKIGKILQAEYQEEIKRINQKFQQKQISEIKYKSDLEFNNRYYKELLSIFNSSPLRTLKNSQVPYMIVISNKSEDIAAMSTNRNWESCMNLEDGLNKESVYCEIKNGGFVAYLCYSNDKEINNPIARIHIRRFDNKAGKSVAIPEDTVYGNDMNGFATQVKEWLFSKQGRIKSGKYIRQGGWYSDTFGTADPEESLKSQRRDMIHSVLPQTPKGMIRYYKKYPKQTSVLSKLLDINLFLDDESKQQVIKIVKEEHPEFLGSLFNKYPELLNNDDFVKLSHYQREKLATNNPKFDSLNKDLITNSILSFDVNNPSLKINNSKYSKDEAYYELSDIVRNFQGLKQLSEPLIKKLISIAEHFLNSVKKDISWTTGGWSSPLGIVKNIVHVLSMANADTPSVINFYQKLLPYWDKQQGNMFLDGLGYALTGLKQNGKIFLPFLKQKLIENQDKNEYYIEKLNYIIYSIENHDKPNIYKFF